MFYISLSEKFPLFRKKMKRFYFSFIFQPQYLFLLLSSLRVSLFLLQCLKENTYLIQLLSNLEALPYSNIHLFFPTYLISELSLHRLFLSTLNAAVIILAQWREKNIKKDHRCYSCTGKYSKLWISLTKLLELYSTSLPPTLGTL